MFSQMASLYKLQRKLSMNTHQFIASNPIVPLNTHVIYLLMSQNLNSEQNTTHNLFAKGPIDQKSARLVKWLRIRIKLSNETMMAMVAHAYVQRKTSVHYFVCTYIYAIAVTSHQWRHMWHIHTNFFVQTLRKRVTSLFFSIEYIYMQLQWRHISDVTCDIFTLTSLWESNSQVYFFRLNSTISFIYQSVFCLLVFHCT